MIAYVDNIRRTCLTIFDGLAVTFSHLFRTPITVQYPDRIPRRLQETLPDRYRGHLEVDLDICISCRACEKACPIECIVIEDVKIPRESVTGTDGKETARVKEPTRFDINLYKCMYCGLCVEPCPTGAIRHTKEFEGSTADLSSLLRRFVAEERKALVLAKGEAYEREQAEKAAKKAAQAKESAGPGADTPGDKPAPAGEGEA